MNALAEKGAAHGGTAEDPDPEYERNGLCARTESLAEWTAAALSRLFYEKVSTATPGRIRAATLRRAKREGGHQSVRT
jgi:hypothetical protein